MVQARQQVRSAVINVMSQAIEKAARGLIRDFNEIEHLQVSRKGLGDFVSTADHRSEKILIQELQKARPTYGFITEESGVIEGENPEFSWIIDPLDGTTNFLHSIPHFAISLALKKGNEIVAGIVYDPIKDEQFWAEKGAGAFMNQRRLRVSGRRNLDEALIATGIPFSTLRNSNRQEFIKRLSSLIPFVAGVRRLGAAALDLAYVAAGRYEAYFESDLSIWDIAAGILLVKEAGGYLSDLKGGNDVLKGENILASNKELYEDIKKILE